MKKILTLLFLFFLVLPMNIHAAPAINAAGYYKGIRLAGRVRVVEHFGNIKVKVVTAFPDLKVKIVEHFPHDIGEWQFVEHGEDFTIQFVSNFEDIKIKHVTAFPGVS